VDADCRLIQISQIAGVEAEISKDAIHGRLECSLRVRVRLAAAFIAAALRGDLRAWQELPSDVPRGMPVFAGTP
jgi:hypothetical protein